DAEEGALTATSLSWQINFHHDIHVHDGVPVSGIASGTFDVPDEGEVSANVWYRFILTATDTQGATGKDSVDVLPRKSTLNFATQPAGLQILLDGQPQVTPLAVESVEGIKRQIGVNEEQSLNGNTYAFTQWTHGGAATQVIVTPAADVTYIAEFSLVVGVENSREILFPNPTSGWLYLQEQVTPIRLTNYLGQAQPIQSERESNQTRLDLRALAAGMYIFIYEYNQARSITKILIVR
ncbi:MAG TPA: T9SS type A sorting domain-containing protein, partial [Cyclobacteriaceae bacterium]|nr:T9SS type A sorting domain-containing protein [Cyclobacteriaceae bacterium]